MMTEQKFRVGDRVRWRHGAAWAEGDIVEVATRSGCIGDFVYNASKEFPRYIVQTAEGRRAAPRAEALIRTEASAVHKSQTLS